MKVTGGATGKYTKQKEYDLNLKITRYNLKEIPQTGTREELLNKYNLNISEIVKKL